MADNYIGNRMDDYRAGRLRQESGRSRRLSPTGNHLGQLNLGIRVGLRVWLPQNALSEAGLALMRELRGAAVAVSYRAEASRRGAEPAMSLGARHYPDGAAAPAEEHQEIIVGGDRFEVVGHAVVSFAPGLELLAARNVLLLLALPIQSSTIHIHINQSLS